MSLTTELGDFFLLTLQMSKRLGKVKSYDSEVRKQTREEDMEFHWCLTLHTLSIGASASSESRQHFHHRC